MLLLCLECKGGQKFGNNQNYCRILAFCGYYFKIFSTHNLWLCSEYAPVASCVASIRQKKIESQWSYSSKRKIRSFSSRVLMMERCSASLCHHRLLFNCAKIGKNISLGNENPGKSVNFAIILEALD